MLNLELQGKRSDLVICAQKIKGYVGKLKYWKKQFEKKNLLAFENVKKTDPTSKCISACIVHLEGLHTESEFERRFEDLLKMDYPLWFVDLKNYKPEDESTELAETLLDLKEDVKLRREQGRGICVHFDKGFAPKCFPTSRSKHHCLLTIWMVESAFSAVLDVSSTKRNKLDINSRGTIRLRLNDFVNIDFDSLCQKHQNQESH